MNDAAERRRARLAAKSLRWVARHPEQARASNDRWARNNPERKMYSTAKCRAKKRGRDFTISLADIVIPDFCPVLGIRIESAVGKGKGGGTDNSPSLDRIDGTKGYVPGNVQVISHLANSMKSSASPEQLLRFAKWVQATYVAFDPPEPVSESMARAWSRHGPPPIEHVECSANEPPVPDFDFEIGIPLLDAGLLPDDDEIIFPRACPAGGCGED